MMRYQVYIPIVVFSLPSAIEIERKWWEVDKRSDLIWFELIGIFEAFIAPLVSCILILHFDFVARTS